MSCSKRLKENFVCIQGYWPNRRGEIDTKSYHLWVGKVDFFLSQNINTNDGIKEVIKAQVTWFEEHAKKNCLMDPIEI